MMVSKSLQRYVKIAENLDIYMLKLIDQNLSVSC